MIGSCPKTWKPALVAGLLLSLVQFDLAGETNLAPFRPPSVPLVTHDPYFSIWSPADKLTDADTVHWTGRPHRLTSLVRVDGKAFRVMGKAPAGVPALPQTNLAVLPTRTIYTFGGAGVRLTLTFMTPALPENLEVLTRPVTYLTWQFISTDGNDHAVEVYFDASPEIAVNKLNQVIKYAAPKVEGLSVLAVGTVDQPKFKTSGDKLRIDWGHFYVASPRVEGAMNPLDVVSRAQRSRTNFVARGCERWNWKLSEPMVVSNDAPVINFTFAARKTGKTPVTRWLMLAYDDEHSIRYFKKYLRPYWRRPAGGSEDAAAMLQRAAADYELLRQRCEQFDAELMGDLTQAGGAKYAWVCALAYRQCLAGNKIVADRNGQPLMFPKENSSSGVMSTVGVSYPMSPQFLLLSPTLLKAALVPILAYSSSGRWRWPYAPHELGRFPIANGPTYDGGEEGGHPMPVEDTGNMLIMLAALAQIEGNADFCKPWWPLIEGWAGYLKTNGFDPEKQLSGDDFAGAIAHDANLSLKTICALGGFARLCELRGRPLTPSLASPAATGREHGGPDAERVVKPGEEPEWISKAAEYSRLAKTFAARWMQEADDGGHFRLAFDQPGTWSQKYNLVWDRVLGLHLFPDSVREQEMQFYRARLNEFGLPLDSRETYTKLDWELWVATLTQHRDDFAALANPVWRFVNETKQRVPLSDWVWTQRAAQRDFQARPVVGAFFLQLLYDPAVWRKWAARDTNRPAHWSPILQPPKFVTIIPTAENAPVLWRYTTQPPAADWNQSECDSSAWKEGPAPFGIAGGNAAAVRTQWNTPDIWLRRKITFPEGQWTELSFRLNRAAHVQIYLNGVLAATFPGHRADYQQVRIKTRARETIKPGPNVVAVHAARAAGDPLFDVGIVDVREADD